MSSTALSTPSTSSAPSAPRTPPAPRLATALFGLLLIALGLQLAWWFWHFMYPPWQDARPSATQTEVPIGLGRQLFGDKDGPAPGNESSASAVTGVRLKGVVAVDGKTLAAAVVNLGGRDQTVYLKQEFSPGISLLDVKPDHIIVSRNGARERIDLDKLGTKPGPTSATTTTGGPAPTNFRLNVASTGNNAYALSRQELNTVLQDPRQMNFLGRIGPAPAGGVRVEDSPAGSLANKLGLQAGDVITAINGQPINSPGDLARVYGQFDSISTIRAEVKRSGAPVVMNYSVKN
jgi:general secretion pathway protein C